MQKFILILLLFASCKKEERKLSVLSLREMSEVATVEYNITKIIKANDNKTWYKIGDRKILMSCEATIKAGVDLSGITKNSFEIDDKNIRLKLPPPKIISLNILPEKIKIEYQEVGVLRQPFNSAERDQLARQAETQIKNSVDELGILDQAKANTSLFVSNILKQLGYNNVTITYEDSPQLKTLQ